MVARKKEWLVLFLLPLLVELTSLYNMVFIRMGISRSYIMMYALAFVALFFVPSSGKNRPSVYSYLLVGCLLLVMVIHMLFGTQEPSMTFMATMTYVLPISYWTCYCHKSAYYVYDILDALKYPMAIIAILGLLQFFVSPTLWGFYDPEGSALEWASNSDLDSYRDYLRIGSILDTPQVLALVFGLYTVVFLKYFMKRRMVHVVLLLLYFAMGLLSGSKSYFFVVGMYFFLTLLGRNTKASTRCAYILLLLLAIGLLVYLQDYITFLSRLTNAGQIAEEEDEGRLRIWQKILEGTTFWGNGPGISQSIGGYTPHYVCTESYLLMILYETGVLPFLLFLCTMISNFFRSSQKAMLLICFASMTYVHVFGSFTMFIFWPFVLLPKVITGNNHNK